MSRPGVDQDVRGHRLAARSRGGHIPEEQLVPMDAELRVEDGLTANHELAHKRALGMLSRSPGAAPYELLIGWPGLSVDSFRHTEAFARSQLGTPTTR